MGTYIDSGNLFWEVGIIFEGYNNALQHLIGDDQNKIKRPLLQGLANTSVHCISVSVLRGFALVAFGDLKISINYNCLLYIPYSDCANNAIIFNRGLPNPHRKINGHFAPICTYVNLL